MSLAASKMSPVAQLNHQSGGLEGIKRLKALRDQIQTGENQVRLAEELQSIHHQITRSAHRFLLIGDESMEESFASDLANCWQEHRAADSTAMLSFDPVRDRVCEAWTTATQVNFCAKAYPTVPAGHEDSPALHVLAGFLRNGFLHTAIREQGGAYGGGASQDPNSASFRFFSYRDPRLEESLLDFDRSIDWLMSNEHPYRRLEEAILGVIAAMDKSNSPAGEAKQAFYNYLFGRTLEQRIEFRQRVLATSIEDLRRVGERYLAPEQASIGIITDSRSAEGLDIEGLQINNI